MCEHCRGHHHLQGAPSQLEILLVGLLNIRLEINLIYDQLAAKTAQALISIRLYQTRHSDFGQ